MKTRLVFPLAICMFTALLHDGLWGETSSSTKSDPKLEQHVFRFKDGRVISGTVVHKIKEKSGNRSITVWTVEVAPKSYVRVLESELKRDGHRALFQSELEYKDQIAKLPQTAEAHAAIAGWCRQHGMVALANAHYRRALDLDPNHGTAREEAGYKKDRDGRWVKKEVVMGGQRGKVHYKGRWRFPESVAIEQANELAKREIAPLKKQLRTWHNFASMAQGKRQQTAMVDIQSIRDPRAVSIISGFLLDARTPTKPFLKLLYVRVLSKFKTAAAAQTLATASMNDPYQEVRNACLDALRGFGGEVAIPMYISYLGNSQNELVNRAAEGLGQFNPPQAVLPLIRALNTKHVVVPRNGPQMNVGNQGAFAIGGGAKKQTVLLRNSSVLGTLTQITGENLDYDQAGWMAWYASIHAAPADDLRRDP